MKSNLLIVDDEIELTQNMKELLEDDVQKIFLAHNGEEALEILKSEKIDCIISDIRMPVMDGLTMFEVAKERGISSPFIFYTGHGSQELKDRVLELGAFDLLTKPNFINLEMAIKEALA